MLIKPITKLRQLKRVGKFSVLILNDLVWVRREIWHGRQKINMTVSLSTFNKRLYIFLRLPPWGGRILLTMRELLWRTEFLNFKYSFNVTPKKLLKWLKLCADKDVLHF